MKVYEYLKKMGHNAWIMNNYRNLNWDKITKSWVVNSNPSFGKKIIFYQGKSLPEALKFLSEVK